MRNIGMSLMLATMMVGCKGPGSWEGIWMVQVPLTDADECEPDIDENFKDASVPEEEEIEEPDYTTESDTKRSDSVYFVQVLEQGGEVFVFVDDTPYYGTAEGKSLTASWTDLVDTETVSEHIEGYRYVHKDKTETTTTLTFTRGDKGVVTGVIDETEKSDKEWIESDDWVPSDVQFADGQINGPASSELENDEPGGSSNSAQDDDCDGDDCELFVRSNCQSSVDVQVFYAGDHDEGMYNSLEDATREYGGLGI